MNVHDTNLVISSMKSYVDFLSFDKNVQLTLCNISYNNKKYCQESKSYYAKSTENVIK